jgi:flavin reductase (DIM6/NTAB) family NADH-FMN oxidoreductase RutF
MIGAILPRPIAWVSTMDSAGNLNIAPYSYFTAVCSSPMTLVFCPGYSPQKEGKKDTLRNIEALPEFVINLVNEEVAEAMNLTAAILPHSQSEFEFAGLTPVPSETVQVPYVAEAPIAFECKLQRIVTVSDQPGGGSAVFGEVQCIHVRDDIYQDGYILLEAYKPIGRLGGAGYVRVTDTFEMQRPSLPAKS